MAAYPLDGSPTVTFVGMDPSDLSWQVNYPAGSQLMLALIDADGNSGGVMPSILTVAVPSVTANVTQDLAACEPLGLTIRGGTRPYTVSVVGIDSAVSNFTLGPRDDIFTWTNQASVDTDVLCKAVLLLNWVPKLIRLFLIFSRGQRCIRKLGVAFGSLQGRPISIPMLTSSMEKLCQ
ncbi:hypothetical protein EWM64_g10401 [Hericium alpestre]|uniref:Uncharacterized protein n=1 Tax=Hericium alpestre TaxID=135208 RepID=A0A4Y9ZIF9_9AGAM|nr:hypothetical protein EWM64_g10401 [Hericium alpestre]